jgi:hypothetical protein
LTDVKNREASFDGREPKEKKGRGPRKGIKRMQQLLRQVFSRTPPAASR